MPWSGVPDRDYGMNEFIAQTGAAYSVVPRQLSIARISDPAGIFLVGEALRSTLGGYCAAIIYGRGSGGGWTFGHPSAHFDGANFLYCDGHVKWVHDSLSTAAFSAVRGTPTPPWFAG